MTKLSVSPPNPTDLLLTPYLDAFKRRIDATPQGMCPLVIQLSLLQASEAQTCGKCVPCRDGIPRITDFLKKIVAGEGSAEDLATIETLATMVRDTSDCAIGYKTADLILMGLKDFADEYQTHIQAGSCSPQVGQTVPCETGCPAHVHVPAYIALAAEGDYAGSIQMIRKDNPFPTACAFVCEHPCESHCRRTMIDAPINIRGIKKFAVDQLSSDQVPVPQRSADTGRKVAVIGGGPSGMTCAYYLALMGHEVTIFEAHKQLGGMMRYGIPAYRFPRERLDEDIRAILSVGNIEVRYETPVEDELLAQIREEYDAVYLSIGAQGGKLLGLEGIESDGVISAVSLLRDIGDGDYPDFTGKKVVVIGGGNVAMDCARTSLRCNASEVSIVYRRRQEDMTALTAEVESAIAEGVEMVTLQAPVRVESDENGHCTALITQPQMIGAVKRGRPAPQAANKPERRIEADIVLVAVGQQVMAESFEAIGAQVMHNHLVTNDQLEVDGLPGFYAGGDCHTGPKTVIMAIGAGKVAARNIDDYLGFNHTLDHGVDAPLPTPNDRTPMGRVNINERPARERRHDFAGVEEEMSIEEALQECGRCLRCDHYGCGATEGGRITHV